MLLREGKIGGDVLLVEGRLLAAARAAREVLERVCVDGRRLFGHLQIAAALREMAANGQHDGSFRQRFLKTWSKNRVMSLVLAKNHSSDALESVQCGHLFKIPLN